LDRYILGEECLRSNAIFLSQLPFFYSNTVTFDRKEGAMNYDADISGYNFIHQYTFALLKSYLKKKEEIERN
jgi:hypothetical protein